MTGVRYNFFQRLVFAPGSWQLKTFPKTSHFNPWEKAMFPAFSSDSSAGSGENE
jgi:hypothetical protein